MPTSKKIAGNERVAKLYQCLTSQPLQNFLRWESLWLKANMEVPKTALLLP